MEVEGGRDSVSDICCTIDKRVFKRVSHTENSLSDSPSDIFSIKNSVCDTFCAAFIKVTRVAGLGIAGGLSTDHLRQSVVDSTALVEARGTASVFDMTRKSRASVVEQPRASRASGIAKRATFFDEDENEYFEEEQPEQEEDLAVRTPVVFFAEEWRQQGENRRSSAAHLTKV